MLSARLVGLWMSIVMVVPSAGWGISPSDMLVDSIIIVGSKAVDVVVDEENQYIIVATLDGLAVYSMFPARKIQSLRVGFQPGIVAIGPEGSVYVVGFNYIDLEWTAHLYVLSKRDHDEDGNGKEPYRLRFHGTFGSPSYFSSVSVSRQRRVAMTDLFSPALLSKVYDELPPIENRSSRATMPVFDPPMDREWLSCGPAGQVSIIDRGKDTYFVASTIRGGGIEIGVFGRPPSESCETAFSVFEPTEEGGESYYPMHRLFHSESAAAKRVLGEEYLATVAYIDSSARRVGVRELLQVDKELDYLREVAVSTSKYVPDFGTAPGHGILVADGTGETLLVASGRDPRILIFKVEGPEPVFRGWLNLGGNVRAIDVGRYGQTVGAVLDRSDMQEVIVTRNFGSLKVNDELPKGRYTILSLQNVLAERGYDPGPLDGVLGARTVHALREMFNLPSAPQSTLIDIGVEQMLIDN